MTDVTHAEMPPDRRSAIDPVRGGARQNMGETQSESPMNRATSFVSTHASTYHHHGASPPATALPIIRGNAIAGRGVTAPTAFPPSPPSTPASSPPSFENITIRSHGTQLTDHAAAPDASPASHLSGDAQPACPVLEPSTAAKLLSAAAATVVANAPQGTLPDTPEHTPLTMSPADGVQHHPAASARAFMKRIFPALPAEAAVEDAGIELVCPGWEGAVLDRTAADEGRTLYVNMPTQADASALRENVVAILDVADEPLACVSVVICIDKNVKDLGESLLLAHAVSALPNLLCSDHHHTFFFGTTSLASPRALLRRRPGLVAYSPLHAGRQSRLCRCGALSTRLGTLSRQPCVPTAQFTSRAPTRTDHSISQTSDREICLAIYGIFACHFFSFHLCLASFSFPESAMNSNLTASFFF